MPWHRPVLALPFSFLLLVRWSDPFAHAEIADLSDEVRP